MRSATSHASDAPLVEALRWPDLEGPRTLSAESHASSACRATLGRSYDRPALRRPDRRTRRSSWNGATLDATSSHET
jgi:hypothetical protein